MTFKAASARLSLAGTSEISLQPSADDTNFFGPANIDETGNGLEFMMRSADGRYWLQVNLESVSREGKFDDFQTDRGDGRITLTVGEICDGASGKLLDDACAWHSSDFYSSNCVVELTDIDDEAVRGRVECGALGSNCTPDSTGDRDPSGICRDRIRRPHIALAVTFELAQPVDVVSGVARSPRSLVR